MKDKPQANTNTIDMRKSICFSCPYFANEVCGECDCLVEQKTLYEESKCPIGKW